MESNKLGPWLCLPWLLLLQQAAVMDATQGWEWITRLPEMDGQQFKQIAEPLVEMSANAYRYPAVIDIPGWILASAVPPLAPPHGGVHALVYEEEDWDWETSRRMVLSFRGTQLGDTEDCIADQCADLLLWDNIDPQLLPPICDHFSSATLDYYSQAVNYTQQVLEAYPSGFLLLTGHSLGAGLALLVSAALSTCSSLPVIAFGSAGTRTALARRSLSLAAEEEHKVFIIANEWDEIMRTTWGEQLGTLCLYNTTLSAACAHCLLQRPPAWQESPRGRVCLEDMQDQMGAENVSFRLIT